MAIISGEALYVDALDQVKLVCLIVLYLFSVGNLKCLANQKIFTHTLKDSNNFTVSTEICNQMSIHDKVL